MNDSKFLQAAGVVGLRTPLRVNDKTFVGRERQIANMQSAVFGTQITPLWICGPRRIGKSSLSNRIGSHDVLSVIKISCDQFMWKGMDEMVELLCQNVAKELKIKKEGKGKDLFKELAGISKSDYRIVLVLDEFDGIAVNLQQSEQAFLRGTLQDNPYFGMVFISRAKPEQLLQDYSQESSRLLGICEVIRVPMLSMSDIRHLLEIVGGLCCEKIPTWFLLWIYDRVGGYPICVQKLVKEYLILAHNIGALPSEKDLYEHEFVFFEAIKDDLLGLCSDIPYQIKNILKDETCTLTSAVERELKAFNLFRDNAPFRPLWLLEVAEECDQPQDDQDFALLGLAEKLSNLIQNCNEIMLRKGSHQVFQITHEALKLFKVARQVNDALNLNDRINTLHKICIENTNSNLLPKEDRCLLPQEIRKEYKKSEGYLIIVAWRNFCFHDPSQDLNPIEASIRFKNIGEIYSRYLGPEKFEPTTENDYNTLYRGILRDVVDSVEKLKMALQGL